MKRRVHDFERAYLERIIKETPAIAERARSKGDYRLAALMEQFVRATAGLLAAIDSEPLSQKDIKRFLMRIESLDYEMRAEAKYHLWRLAIKDTGKDNVVSFRTRDNPGPTR
jgi:hypothetical protein